MYRYLEKGFTLLELMIVIAIIGTLAVVLFPSFSYYFAKSRDVGLMMEYKSLVKGLDIYQIDTETYPELSIYGCISPGCTEIPVNNLSGILVPGYLSRMPKGKDVSQDRYTDCNNPASCYTLLVHTEVMYGSGITTRGHTCITGIYNNLPIQSGVSAHFSDGGVIQPICTFQ